jgi:exonuclease SbcC
MLLKRLVLHNIRSYTDATLEFPDGIVLLSGDIGAGKSTILLSIEFALFGIQRGELSGSALLRHGENQGWVELEFELGKETIIISRTLKRSNGSIAQDNGHIMRNGLRQDGTATELKAMMLELLGYPADMLTKGKNLLYRYTVYTPQEEMKRILEESADERLMTLRRLFNIDKYERIKENSKIVLQSLREKERELDGRLSLLPQRTLLASQLQTQQGDIGIKLSQLAPTLEKNRLAVTDARTAIHLNEEKLNELFAIKREIATIEAQQRVHKEQSSRLEKENNLLRQEIDKMGAVPKPDIETAALLAAKKEAELSIGETERALVNTRSQITTIITRLQMSANTVKSVESLDFCPTCKQQVTREHRVGIIEEESSKRNALSQEQKHHEARLLSLQEQLSQHKKRLETARQQEQQLAIQAVQRRLLEDKKARFNANESQLAHSNGLLSQFSAQFESSSIRLAGLGDIETMHKTLTLALEKAQEQEKQTAIAHAALSQQRETLNNQLQQVIVEIAQLGQTKAERNRTTALRDWVGNRFVPLVASIENHVFAAVHHQFDGLFVKWFSLLIDDPLLNARIARDFGVSLQQNGYDTSFENLSGGERTATALAYRFALNRVVNDLVDTINTKDLLILDEPTDGFSAEQLEKVRDVLQELRCKQVIIVSHEAQLEGFVDFVLRVVKSEHNSAVA